MGAKELPKEFVYHADCMINWRDIPNVDVEAVETYVKIHKEELIPPILQSNPTLTPETIDDWMLEEYALEKVFPEIAETKDKIEYEKALIAYENRGTGECPTCAKEAGHCAC
jgi:hypothetical protein